jgi:DNA (cytosine-5)-methyltransferase 1
VNGYTVASSFSGCGGSCLGFELAGFEVVWANEFIEAAAEVYRLNHPHVPLDVRDVRKIDPLEVLHEIHAQCGRNSVDVLEGSPPCASFSTAGGRHHTWGEVRKYSETRQRVDDLFWEFARLVEGIQPRVFVAENVSGLVKGKAKGYFKEILRRLRSCGYAVHARMLDAQWLGIPQVRQRLIFVGVRDDLVERGALPAFPSPLPYRYTIEEVLPHVRALQLGGAPDRWDSADRPASTVVQSGATTGPTGYFSATQVELQSGERRRWSIEELKVLSGFPADFALTGTYEQQWERLGRAVPPPMMRAVAEVIRDRILVPLDMAELDTL